MLQKLKAASYAVLCRTLSPAGYALMIVSCIAFFHFARAGEHQEPKAEKHRTNELRTDHSADEHGADEHGADEHGEAEHREDEHGHDSELILLEPAQKRGVGSVTIQRGTLTKSLRFPAEVRFDPKRVAHLTPRVAGMVKSVLHGLGDTVKQGEPLALLVSRELGVARAQFMAAEARLRLHDKMFAREKSLWERGISAELSYLQSEQALDEHKIELRLARESLLALGVNDKNLTAMPEETQLNEYVMRMPFDGRIVEQHVTLGEMLSIERAAFTVVDNRRVWVMAKINEVQLNQVQEGQQALVRFSAWPDKLFNGTLDYIDSRLDPESRTAEARLVLANEDGALKEGMFGTVTVLIPQQANALIVPKSALQRMDSGQVVFLEQDGGYKMVAVTVVAESDEMAEIQGDLAPGQRLAAGDTFILKSQVGKAAMGGGHSH